MSSSRFFRLAFVLITFSGLAGSALCATNALSERIALADHIVATNWAAAGFGGQPFSIPITGDKVKAIVKAVSTATHYANQEHPDWEWDWQLRFYEGTNLLAAICFARDTFLTDG